MKVRRGHLTGGKRGELGENKNYKINKEGIAILDGHMKQRHHHLELSLKPVYLCLEILGTP